MDTDTDVAYDLLEKSYEEILELKKTVGQLEQELQAYRDSVRIDVQMDGPKFMGCNVSQLRRAWEMTKVSLLSL